MPTWTSTTLRPCGIACIGSFVEGAARADGGGIQGALSLAEQPLQTQQTKSYQDLVVEAGKHWLTWIRSGQTSRISGLAIHRIKFADLD